MDKNDTKYPDTKSYNYIISEFDKRGIKLEDIAVIAKKVQSKWFPDITYDECTQALIKILHEREVMNIVMVALTLDNLATENKLPQPLQTIVAKDLWTMGVDELLAIGLSQLRGSIAVTNYGHVDVIKHGIIKEIDEDTSRVNTFLDDILGALAASVMAHVAHKRA